MILLGGKFYVALGEIKVWLSISKDYGTLNDKKNYIWAIKYFFVEDKEITMIDKFNGNNINFHKFKLEMVLATKDFWKIVHSLEALPPYTAIDKWQEEVRVTMQKDL